MISVKSILKNAHYVSQRKNSIFMVKVKTPLKAYENLLQIWASVLTALKDTCDCHLASDQVKINQKAQDLY